ncbi:hypothetical protein L210DRAFT_3762782, partial [Boletus edulis BED1]
MLVSAVKQAARHRAACYHWRPFHIDNAGHGDWEGSSEPRTIQVRFSCVPESIVDAVHGLRAIERQFGRIRDYRLLRDSEIRSEYQAICWAAFESPRSLLRVPPQGTTLKVTLPPPLRRPEGGPGLDDLKGLLVPEDCGKPNPSSSEDESAEPARFVRLTVKRAATAITFRNTVKPPFRSRAMKAAIGHAFLEWGGFAPLKPIYENMRMALNKWSQILGVADPLFPEMKQPLGDTETQKIDTGDDWEPLSEPFRMPGIKANPAEEIEEIEMTPSAQESLRQSLEGLLQRSLPRPSDVNNDRMPFEKLLLSFQDCHIRRTVIFDNLLGSWYVFAFSFPPWSPWIKDIAQGSRYNPEASFSSGLF